MATVKDRRFGLITGKIKITALTELTSDDQAERALDHIGWHRIEAVLQAEVKRVSRLVFNDDTVLRGTIEL